MLAMVVMLRNLQMCFESENHRTLRRTEHHDVDFDNLDASLEARISRSHVSGMSSKDILVSQQQYEHSALLLSYSFADTLSRTVLCVS